MNKNIYITAVVCMILGLYIPRYMQFAVTIMLISSLATYVFTNLDELFGSKNDKKRQL